MVKNDYGVAPEKIFELPFGANIPNDIINKYYFPKSAIGPELKLLFISADWKRKGGDKAIKICHALMKSGISVRLVVIGPAPEDISRFAFIDVGFLRKSDRAQLESICCAYQQAHFFLLPTIADAYGIVFSESQAFGVPPITHLVGGTPSAIDHGKAGLSFPLDASPELIAEAIIPYIREPSIYEELCRECRRWYLEKAQWSHWCRLIMDLAA